MNTLEDEDSSNDDDLEKISFNRFNKEAKASNNILNDVIDKLEEGAD
jgi:hypothetical protein